MSILTYNVYHNIESVVILDLLAKARKIAEVGIKHHFDSSKEVKHLGLKSSISNAVMRKYNAHDNIKHVSNVVIPVPKESISWDGSTLTIVPLKVSFPFNIAYHPNIERILHLELDKTQAHIACEISDTPRIVTNSFIGVDVNSKQFLCVVGNPNDGKVMKLGKDVNHIHEKYRRLRGKFEKEGARKKHHKHRHSRSLKRREKHICKHRILGIARQIVDYAKELNVGIFLENLKGLRMKKGRKTHIENGKTVKSTRNKNGRYALNSWAYYQLQQAILHYAHLQGLPVIFINPAYTSQRCSLCGKIGERNGKIFKCPHCGHADHADVNAAFNIGVCRSGLA